MNKTACFAAVITLSFIISIFAGAGDETGIGAPDPGVTSSMAAVPQGINYQGILTDSNGDPVTDGSYDITFRLYTVAVGGGALWAEPQTVQTYGGLFNALLPIPQDQFDGTDRWLGIQVDPDPEMTPRQQIACVPYAYLSSDHSLDAADGDPADALYVDDDGSVGIGTTTPLQADHGGHPVRLDIRNGGVALPNNSAVSFEEAVSGFSYPVIHVTDDSELFMGDINNVFDGIRFYAGGSTQLRLTADGKVGIGTLNPSEQLDVQGNARIDGDLTVTGEIDPVSMTFKPQASAPAVAEGKVYYDAGDDELYVHDGTGWQALISGGGGGVSQVGAGTGITVTNPTGPTVTVAAKIGTGAGQVAAGNHDHDADYVNEVGPEVMSGNSADPVLTTTNSGSGDGLKGETSGSDANGVYGYATGYHGQGVKGYASAEQGFGVYGHASETYGVGGWFTSAKGVGLFASGGGGNLAADFDGDVRVREQLQSTVAPGTPPLTVNSSTVVSNLNADMLDGQHASDFLSTAGDYGRSGVSADLYEGTTALSDKYVNSTGPEQISANSGQHALYVYNNGNGHALWGTAHSSYCQGVTGWANGDNGKGVRGSAFGNSGYGGYFESEVYRGLYAKGGGGYEAAYLHGDVDIIGDLQVSGNANIQDDLWVQGNIGAGTSSPQRPLHINDVLRIEPRSSAPGSPAEGDLYVNSSDHHIYCYLDGAWKQLD